MSVWRYTFHFRGLRLRSLFVGSYFEKVMNYYVFSCHANFIPAMYSAFHEMIPSIDHHVDQTVLYINHVLVTVLK
jgi:hypothetical protein